MAIQNARDTGSRVLPDKVYHVEKAVVSKDQHLVIYLEGSLSNSTVQSQFTVSIPLNQIRNASEQTYKYESNSITCSDINVPRSTIHLAWPPQDENAEIVQVGQPISTPHSAGGIEYMYYTFGEDAKLLPGSTKTLYPIAEWAGWPAQLQFMYVDASCRQKFINFHVELMTVPNGQDIFYYFLVPVTVPIDIVTAPFQAIGIMLMLSSFGHNC